MLMQLVHLVTLRDLDPDVSIGTYEILLTVVQGCHGTALMAALALEGRP